MFEDSLFASQPTPVSPRSRWSTAAALLLQGVALSLFVLLPLLHPGILPMPKPPLQMLLPQRTPPPVKITHVAATDPASAAPSESFAAPRILLNTIDTSPEPPIAVGNLPGSMASGPGFLSSLAEVPHPAVRVAEAPASHAPVHISSGISTGLLLTPIRPVYPAMAKVTHTEGTVVVEAIISKSGGIESLRVVSGPALLQSAAIDAIRVARYRPFLLNGEPVEVQTTITVNFRMSN